MKRRDGARPRVLDRAEMPVDTVELARFLIGKMLVRTLAEGVAGGRIVETEAYGIGDPAGHAYRGITPRNRALFLERGHAYVYLAYGISFMLNVSSETSGVGAGVLIRAIEPTVGIAIMAAKSRRRSAARLGAGAGTAVRGLEDRSPAGRDRPLSGRPAVARIRRSGAGRNRPEQTDRHYARSRQSLAILRSRAIGSSAVRGRSTSMTAEQCTKLSADRPVRLRTRKSSVARFAKSGGN